MPRPTPITDATRQSIAALIETYKNTLDRIPGPNYDLFRPKSGAAKTHGEDVDYFYGLMHRKSLTIRSEEQARKFQEKLNALIQTLNVLATANELSNPNLVEQYHNNKSKLDTANKPGELSNIYESVRSLDIDIKLFHQHVSTFINHSMQYEMMEVEKFKLISDSITAMQALYKNPTNADAIANLAAVENRIAPIAVKESHAKRRMWAAIGLTISAVGALLATIAGTLLTVLPIGTQPIGLGILATLPVFIGTATFCLNELTNIPLTHRQLELNVNTQKAGAESLVNMRAGRLFENPSSNPAEENARMEQIEPSKPGK